MIEFFNTAVSETLESSAIQDSDLVWRNAWDSRGVCAGWADATKLISLVGSSERWAFIVLSRTIDQRLVQCSGSAALGLAVEVGDGESDPKLIASSGTSELPESLLSCGGWSYWVSLTELHAADSAMKIIQSWLNSSSLGASFELHPVHVGGGWVDHPTPARAPLQRRFPM
jgi:hypothetical protein